jgi:hypothetical protein
MKLFIVLLLVAVVVAKDRNSEWKEFKVNSSIVSR